MEQNEQHHKRHLISSVPRVRRPRTLSSALKVKLSEGRISRFVSKVVEITVHKSRATLSCRTFVSSHIVHGQHHVYPLIFSAFLKSRQLHVQSKDCDIMSYQQSLTLAIALGSGRSLPWMATLLLVSDRLSRFLFSLKCIHEKCP